MAFQAKPGSGKVFREENPRSEKSPHYTGYVALDRAYGAGEKVRLALWKDDMFDRYSIKCGDPPRGQRPSSPPEYRDYDRGPGPDDEEIPF